MGQANEDDEAEIGASSNQQDDEDEDKNYYQVFVKEIRKKEQLE